MIGIGNRELESRCKGNACFEVIGNRELESRCKGNVGFEVIGIGSRKVGFKIIQYC